MVGQRVRVRERKCATMYHPNEKQFTLDKFTLLLSPLIKWLFIYYPVEMFTRANFLPIGAALLLRMLFSRVQKVHPLRQSEWCKNEGKSEPIAALLTIFVERKYLTRCLGCAAFCLLFQWFDRQSTSKTNVTGIWVHLILPPFLHPQTIKKARGE